LSFRDPRDVLKGHGLWTKKHFGQNFLIDPSIPDRIAQVGGASAKDVIFEIGAGCGTLTRSLAPIASRVIALEYDRDLAPVARAELAWAENVEIREGNVLDVEWDTLAEEAGQPLVIYGNLPYHLSSRILLELLEHEQSWHRACFMLQKEFAVRLCAKPGRRESSALSVQTALLTWATMVFEVGASSFHPAPKVDSAVVVLERRPEPAAEVGDPRSFRNVVRALYAQRRKMARRALKSISSDPEGLLSAAGIDGSRRGENFTLEEIAALSRALFESKSVNGDR
jgi:16S rRNA (adenine1518-N6/adenine1519-N6)-dimethyltransferase